MKSHKRKISSLPQEDRFWLQVQKTTTCHIWVGKGHGNCNHGYLWFGGKFQYAHRVAWLLTYGSLPTPPLYVLHNPAKCHSGVGGGTNPRCVNPAHLYIGTNQDNVRDKVLEGRTSRGISHGNAVREAQRLHPERLARGDRSPARLYPEKFRGELNGRAKIRAEDVLEIRKRSAAGITYIQLAKEYGLTPGAVGFMVRRRTWKHI